MLPLLVPIVGVLDVCHDFPALHPLLERRDQAQAVPLREPVQARLPPEWAQGRRAVHPRPEPVRRRVRARLDRGRLPRSK